ncbi:MAG TPA: IS200/IS605 family transposase [Epsilonproteobacteria bacterium]|nr:IS200/IS605 family transposase [Campylobacterota bacterium]
MSEHIFKSHNKTFLLYHLVFPAKYRRKVFSKEVEKTLIETCLEISERFEINFLEIGNDEDHVHFLVQGIPKMPVSRIVQVIKSITAREIFFKHKEIKKLLWGGNLWTSGFYANTVGQYASEKVIREYVKNQGKEYNKVHSGQLKFDL